MNDTLLRQWCMLREIPRQPRRIDARTLQDRLDNAGYPIDLRSIQRDLNKLSTVLPLIADGSKPQGWSWSADAPQLDLPALEPQAALVFHLAERYLRPLLPSATLGHLAPWFKAASGVLDAQGNGLSEWRKKVRVLAPGQPLNAPAIDPDIQTVLTQALLENRRIAVSYLPIRAKELKEYVVNPLGLVVRDQSIYLVCTLWDYDDIKQLLLHRMRSATLQDEPAKRLAGFDLDDYICNGEFGLPAESGKKLKLVARFKDVAAIYIAERPLDRGQKIERIDEQTVLLSATVMDTRELRWWLQSFGDFVEVLEPISLREEFSRLYGNLAEIYSDSHK